MGEIDDIFAEKSKSKGKSKEVKEKLPLAPLPSKKKKKKSKKEVSVPESEEVGPATGTKRKVPETVMDPSLPAEPKTKKAKEGKKRGDVSREDDDEDERFKDSRGTGPRRKTEEGFSIYKEDELKIGLEGGDTPLCPFDCECCF